MNKSELIFSSSLCNTPWNKNVRNVLIFAQQRQMEENLDRLGVGGQDNQFRDTTIEGLGGLVGSLFGLLVVGSLLDQIQDGHGQIGISEGEGFLRHVDILILVVECLVL
jgi:hypothetical protein